MFRCKQFYMIINDVELLLLLCSVCCFRRGFQNLPSEDEVWFLFCGFFHANYAPKMSELTELSQSQLSCRDHNKGKEAEAMEEKTQPLTVFI